MIDDKSVPDDTQQTCARTATQCDMPCGTKHTAGMPQLMSTAVIVIIWDLTVVLSAILHTGNCVVAGECNLLARACLPAYFDHGVEKA